MICMIAGRKGYGEVGWVGFLRGSGIVCWRGEYGIE